LSRRRLPHPEERAFARVSKDVGHNQPSPFEAREDAGISATSANALAPG
jgi:hypothetical protein